MFELVLLRWLCITVAWQGESVCACVCAWPTFQTLNNHILPWVRLIYTIICIYIYNTRSVAGEAGPLITRPAEPVLAGERADKDYKYVDTEITAKRSENLSVSTRKVLMISRVAADEANGQDANECSRVHLQCHQSVSQRGFQYICGGSVANHRIRCTGSSRTACAAPL